MLNLSYTNTSASVFAMSEDHLCPVVYRVRAVDWTASKVCLRPVVIKLHLTQKVAHRELEWT